MMVIPQVDLFLFASGNNTGTDLVAINIQRGRDHGLGGYTSYYEVCNDKTVTEFEDLFNVMPKVASI